MTQTQVNRPAILEKFAGKGGWTYIDTPEILPNKKNPFGWEVVSGSIDDTIIIRQKLMPKGNGSLFLPVNATMRKKLGKSHGDTVLVKLQIAQPSDIPSEILDCLLLHGEVYSRAFLRLPDQRKAEYLDWIYSSRSEADKVSRIGEVMRELAT